MKRVIAICLGLVIVQSALTEEVTKCSDRLVNRAIPEFPTSLKATQGLLAGRCTVSVTFDLSENGEPENLTARSSEERCDAFERSAIRSILDSEFSTGDKILGCEILVSYEYENASE